MAELQALFSAIWKVLRTRLEGSTIFRTRDERMWSRSQQAWISPEQIGSVKRGGCSTEVQRCRRVESHRVKVNLLSCTSGLEIIVNGRIYAESAELEYSCGQSSG